MGQFEQLKLLVYLALRSIWAHKVKSTIVGTLMLFGTMLVVSGTALFDSVENSISRSVIQSLAGHLQVYSADAPDKLAIYGGGAMGSNDYGMVPNFKEVKDVIVEVPNVRAVVPMGINLANMTRGSDLDRAFAKLRNAHQTGDTSVPARVIPRVRRMFALLAEEVENGIKVTGGVRQKELQQQLTNIRRVITDEFWVEYRKNTVDALEFLDTKIAPIGGEGRLMYLRYVGTDLTAFAQHFDRFTIVEGAMVPEGQRGILINQKFADRRLKLLAARLFDSLKKGIDEDLSIAENAELRSKARRLGTQSGRLALMLSPDDVSQLEAPLRTLIGASKDANFDDLLAELLTVDDERFADHYRFFYDQLAPRLELYPFKVGDVVTIRAWTRSGFAKAINVRVWGTFMFKGLERSDLSGAANLVDLMTFRSLYGRMSDSERGELEQMRADVAAKTVDRENAEAAFFGEDAELEEEETVGAGFSEFDGISLKTTRRTVDDSLRFTQADIEDGLVLRMAIILEDDCRLAETHSAIADALLAAGHKMNVVDWQEASGFLGQVAILVRIILYIAIFIIFSVALVIINNSMMMATMERVQEIGTLRAMGAQRNFVLFMLLIETFALCLLSGGLGALFATGLMTWLNHVGIPASNDIMVFIFSGSRLYPILEFKHVLLGIVIILIVSLAASFFPARMATRIQPIEAMQSRD